MVEPNKWQKTINCTVLGIAFAGLERRSPEEENENSCVVYFRISMSQIMA
jgi:hypothetical protein